MLIGGNKSDLEDQRKVNVNEVKTFAQENNVTHISCDAKEGINVELAFYKLVEDVLKDIDKGEYFDSSVTASIFVHEV